MVVVAGGLLVVVLLVGFQSVVEAIVCSVAGTAVASGVKKALGSAAR